jgi:hypothetical protein
MKITYLFFVFFLTSIMVKAQFETKPLNPDEYIAVALQAETCLQPLPDPFASIDIIDARDDSSNIGFFFREKGYYYGGYNEKDGHKYYRIFPSFQLGVNTWVTNYLHTKKQDTVQNALLIVIKKFCISSEAVPSAFLGDTKVQSRGTFDAGVISKLEFYLKKDTVFYPLYRFDTVLTYTEKLPRYAGYYVTETLKKSLSKLYTINRPNIYRKKTRLTLEEIVLNNKEHGSVPVLTETPLQKGVYKSFEEFKMNTPSLKEYELRKGKFGDLLYVKENGTAYPERYAWGFCDGTDIFINSSDKYAKLIRRQNTFYFAGIKGVTRKNKYDSPFHDNSIDLLNTAAGLRVYTKPLSDITYDTKMIKYYTVDMETGEVY